MSWGNDWSDNSSSIDNPNNDHLIKDPPRDSISSMQFSPQRDQVVVTSWDNFVSVYDYQIQQNNNGQRKVNSRRKGSKKHDRPVLTACFDTSGNTIFSGGCDNNLYAWDLSKNSWTTICKYHKSAIKQVCYLKEKSSVIAGSWDRRVSFWDLRQCKKSMEINDLGCKVYCMCNQGPLLVLGLSNKHVRWYDIRKGNKHLVDKTTPLKYQLRCMDAFPKQMGFAVASVEGRTAIEYCELRNKNKCFSFKCHRQQNSHYSNNYSDVYSVNALKFHHGFGTFATGGSDGEINIWDKEGRSRLTHLKRLKLPIVALDFDRTGKILGYSSSYDWSQGINKRPKNHQPQIYFHFVTRKEVDPKAPN